MKTGFQCLYVFLTILLFTAACLNSNNNVYKGEQFEINFLNVTELKDGDWIEIDGIRFKHFRSMESATRYKFSLPASNIVQSDDLLDRDYSEPFSGLGIGVMFGNYIEGINKNDSLMVDHSYRYKVSNAPLLMTLGKLNFHRADSSEFTIKTSPDYPLDINTHEFQE